MPAHNTIMSVIVSLPSVLFSIILGEWLNFEDWSALDIACTASSIRDQFLVELAAVPTRTLSTFYKQANSIEALITPAMYQWIYGRNLNLQHLTITVQHFNAKKNLFFKVHFDNIKSITLVGEKRYQHAFCAIVDSCSNLEKLYCFDFGIVNDCSINILSNLKILSVEEVGRNQRRISHFESALERVAKHCKHLKTFECCQLPSENSFDGFCEIIKNNPNLRKLCCSDVKLLSFIIDSFPAIDDLNIFALRYDPTIIASLIEKNSNRRIRIGIENEFFEYVHNPLVCFLVVCNDPHAVESNGIDYSSVIESVCNLTSFVYDGKPLTNELVSTIVMNSYSTLTSFHSEVANISTDVLRQILLKCKNLTSLQFSNITDDIVDVFKDIHIDYFKSVSITGEAIHMSTVCSILKHLTNVKLYHCALVVDFDDDNKTDEFLAVWDKNKSKLNPCCKLYCFEEDQVDYVVLN